MPRNVAMHEPCTWVVSLETDDGIASWLAGTCATLQHDGVTAHGIIES